MGRHTWRWGPAPTAGEPLALDPSQQAVVSWNRGPALVLGGPGTGKTSVLVEAALQRVAEGAAPSSILLLVFGRDAAAEMRQTLALRIGAGEPPRVSTFHSFALDLVSRTQEPGVPLLLLSGAEQERAVREIIDGTLADAALAARWPGELREALPTQGFAREVRSAFAAARALGLSGDEVARIGRRDGSPAWAAVGPVLDEYLEAQAQQQALDYAEVMYRAVALVHDGANAAMFDGLRHVLVDEYQDTDLMQVALLRELARFLDSLVVVGDPDQSIFAFRGSDIRNIRDFDVHFAAMAQASGLSQPATLRLDTTHRLGRPVSAYAAGIFAGTAPAGLSADEARAHRLLRCTGADNAVRAFLYEDGLAEAAWIASQIRELAQHSGAGWDDIAVITRSVSGLGPIERALRRIGVPCQTDVRASRLADEPAVATLLRALEAVSRRDLALEPGLVRELLLSPMCGLDPTELRAIGRTLRTAHNLPSDQAIALAMSHPHPAFELLDATAGADRFEALRALLHRVHARVQAGATPHEVLWLLWAGTPWPVWLQRQAVDEGSAIAHRDLDAVCELFDIADRSVQRRQGHVGVSAFLHDLRAQEVPMETLAGRGFRGPAVQLLTAHLAKGRQWEHVFVAGVNEGIWPNLRRRASVLDVDRLTRDGLVEARDRGALFDEERRLFYVACTRARHTLVVSGLTGDGDDVAPSRLLMAPPVAPRLVSSRPDAVASPAALVAELRRVATDPEAVPALRDAALARLHALARLRDGAGTALFPEADPDHWWSARERTVSTMPVDPAGRPIYVRGSSLEALGNCSLAWFLQQRAHAEGTRGSAVVFGSAIHALIDGVTRGELPADEHAMAERLRAVWNEAGYEAVWQSERDFDEALHAIGRFLHWNARRDSRSVRSEVAFDRVVSVATPDGGTDLLRMRGSIDRLEVDDDRVAVVFDFKTSRSLPTVAEGEANPQLRYYQYAVAQGLLDEALGDGPLRPGGAELVFLRKDGGKADPRGPKVIQQQPMGDAADEWACSALGSGVAVVRSEAFEAVSGKHCALCSMKLLCPLQSEGRVETA